MKILAIKFKNLNSLSGEWQIDLNNSRYLNDGIFAITGPTGSGKSTIFDAVCLALYGQTPRLGKISPSSNEIMSRKKSDCYAQVTFKTESGTFTSFWGQNKRPDGKLQPAKHELSNEITGEILSSKLSETSKKVEELTGMDFARFTRTILLAQGNFDAFLKADKKDRAAILELITGTDIYSRISQKVYERAKSERESLQQIKSQIDELEKSENSQSEQDLQNVISNLKEKQRNLEYSQMNLTRAKEWLEKVNDANNEMNALKLDREKISTEVQDFANEKSRLEKGNKARDIIGKYSQLELLRNAQEKELADLQLQEQNLPELEQKSEEASHELKKAQDEYDASKQARNERMPILNQVRALNFKLESRKNALEKSEARIKSLASESEKASQELSVIQESNSKAQAEFQRATQKLKVSHETFISEFEACIKRFEDCSVECKRREKLLAEARLKLDDSSRDYDIALQIYNNCKLKLENTFRAISETRDELDDLQEQRREKIFDEERAKLHAGMPCPICGSTEHPGISHENVAGENNISELEAQIAKTEDKLKNLIANEVADRKSFTDAHGKITAASNKRSAETQNYDQCMIERDSQGEILAQVKRELLEKAKILGLDKFRGTADLKMQLRQKSYGAKHLENKLKEYSSKIASLESEINTKKDLLDEERDNCAKLKSEYEELLTQRTDLYGNLDNDPDAEDAQINSRFDAASEKLDYAREIYNSTREELQTVKISVSGLRERTDSRKSEIDSRERDFADDLTAKGFADEQEFLDSRLDDNILNDLQSKLNDLNARMNNIDGQLANARKKFAELVSQSVTNKGNDDVEHELFSVKSELDSIQREIGKFESEIAHLREQGAKLQDLNSKLESQREISEKWQTLNDLIGSADGDKFRVFAQKQTLAIVVSHANEQLTKMKNRYTLKITPNDENLSLSVIDREQAGEIRPTKNLSGGESFIVSLALALGLSQISGSHTRVDSLFLDEGFGSLDEDSLNTALDALGNLQSQGRMIGIISHVQALKERIATQIQVIPKNDGESILEGAGCVKLS